MSSQTRRTFLKQASTRAAAAAALAWSVPHVAAGAESRVVVGILGCARGVAVAKELAARNATIAYVCDPDTSRAEGAKRKLGAGQAVADMRRVFDDRSVDAVVVATPDHWHASATLLALQAGKHVYVEKPCSHNIHEGRLMIEAARRAGRVVAVGTQSRSTAAIREAITLLREGAIGEVLAAKAWNSQRRRNIGHQQPSRPPEGFDYDLWVGPAPMRPYQTNCQHYNWHWWYDFGTGDAGNDGVHEIDIARWGLGDPGHPERIVGHGSKLYFDDDQQFPDTLYVTFEYPGGSRGRRLLVYEQRDWSPYVQEGMENGNAFYGTEGMLLLGKESGWKLFGPKNKLLREMSGVYDLPAHAANFLAAIRDGQPVNADLETGHRSAALAHLANLLARTGRGEFRFDPKTEQILNDPESNALVRRTYRQGHWAVPKET